VEEIRRFRPALRSTPPQIVVPGEAGTFYSDLQISEDGRWLSYVQSMGREHLDQQLRLVDLDTGRSSVLVERDRGSDQQLLNCGWLEHDRALVALGARLNPDWTEEVEVLEIDPDGTVLTRGTISAAYGGTARLDPGSASLYLTRVDDDGLTHNLYRFGLEDGTLRRLTRNTIPGVSYAGLDIRPPHRLVYARHQKNEDIWLIRFDR
jgi:hypothetical protein